MTLSRACRVLPDQLPERVAAQIAPLLPAHSSILIGLSGGVDSVVLLHLLHKLSARFSWQLSALHVHHGISPNADAWARFLCRSVRTPSHSLAHRTRGYRTVARAWHRGGGAQAAPCGVCRAGLRFRGAGAPCRRSGGNIAAAIVARRRGARRERHAACLPNAPVQPALLRPLLHCSRQEILDYAAAHQLQWIEDESNADDSYPRNFLRHRVLPLLGERFPAYRDTLARSAQHFAEASRLAG